MSFGEALRFWLKLGFISFGGPAGQIAIMHREMVEQRRWLSEDRFLHALNYCMLLPGPEAQQLATYVGWLLHRIPGALVAGTLFLAPSVFVLLGLSYAYVVHGESSMTLGVLYGFRAVVVAIVVEAVWRIGRRAIQHRAKLVISAGAFGAIYFLQVPFPLIVGAAALAGWLGWRLGLQAFAGPPRGITCQNGETDTATSDGDHGNRGRPLLSYSVKVVALGVVLWLVCLALIGAGRGFDSLHAQEYWFFTKAAFVTFGGAYAVLAYVAQAAGSAGWVSEQQMVDGLALAETTPGPLIMVVQFVGFVAAWNHPQGLAPVDSAILGALITTAATFLPCFLFILVGAPYIESLRAHRGLSAALSGVTAAVVGVVLNLALVFGAAVLVPEGSLEHIDWLAAALASAAFVALWRFGAGVVWVIVIGGLIGLLQSLLSGGR
ncbi:MAG TPA: chromate efflux transporter [Acidobacteriota bacterium]|nr:chromate efflux transporter [Acidobacteriota bacterium]